MTYLEVIIWSKLEVIIWSKLGAFKKRQLGPDNNFQFFARNVFFKKNVLKPHFIVVFGNRCFRKNKLGPDNNFQNPQTWTR